MKNFFLASFAPLLLCLLLLAAAARHGGSDSSALSHQLAHASISIRAASFAAHADGHFNEAHHRDASAAAHAAAAASPEEAQELSDHIYHKGFSVFSPHSSRAYSPSPSSSPRLLGAQKHDQQFYVRFTSRCDIRTLLALQHFTRLQVVAHVERGLYVAIGGEHFAAKARRFPGVAWVQVFKP
jgi:hypothetical protein